MRALDESRPTSGTIARLTRFLSIGEELDLSRPGASGALRLVCLLNLLVVSAGGSVYFHSLSALVLIPLALLTYQCPALGFSVFFLTASIDTAEPVLGSIFISFSEFELAACVLGWLARGRLRGVDWRLLVWAAPFLLVALASGLVNTEWYKAFPHLLRLSEMFVIAVLTSSVFKQREDRASARWALIVAVLFFCSAGLLQIQTAHRGRITSFFGNANQFAGYVNLILPYLLALFFASANQRVRPLWAYLSLGAFLTELATLSRSAVLAVGVSSTTTWILFYIQPLGILLRSPWKIFQRFTRQKGPTIVLHLTLVLAALLVLVSLTSVSQIVVRSTENVLGRSKGGFISSLADFRLPYFRLGGEVWRDHLLLGVGPGRYEEAVADYSQVLEESRGKVPDYEIVEEKIWIHAHNQYLQLGVQYGLSGMLAFVYFLGRISFTLFRHRRRSPWVLGGMGMLLAFMVHGLFDVTFPSLALEMGFLLGISLGAARSDEEAESHSDRTLGL